MSKRMKSTVWCYFTRIDEQKASCDICKLSLCYKTSVTNLKRHIERKHPSVAIDKHMGNPTGVNKSSYINHTRSLSSQGEGGSTQVQTNDKDKINNDFNSIAERSINTIQTDQIRNVPAPGPVPSNTQQSIANFLPKKISVVHQKKLEKLLLRLFTKDFQPFSIVEDTGFSQLVKALNPGFVLPSRKVISQSLLPAAFEQCLNSVKEEMQSVPSVCITVDLWTSVVNESYIAVTAHYVDNFFVLKNTLLECSKVTVSHTGENISCEIKKITDKYSISDKILLVVSDNASNMPKAVTQLKWKHFGCYAHTLNLIVQTALKHVERLKEKIKIIVTHFKRSSHANEKLIQFQINEGRSVPLRLKQDVVTRWNSTYYMVSRLCEIQNAVKSTIALIDKDLPVLTSDEWQICSQLCKVLKPFEEVTRKLSSEKYISGSEVIVLTRGLNSVSSKMLKEQFNEEVMSVLNDLRNGLATRFHNIENSKTAGLCTFLDPRFKLYYFSNTVAADNIKKYATELVVKEIFEKNLRRITEEDMNGPQNEVEDRNIKVTKSSDELSVWAEFDEIMEKVQPSGSGQSTSGAILEVRR